MTIRGNFLLRPSRSSSGSISGSIKTTASWAYRPSTSMTRRLDTGAKVRLLMGSCKDMTCRAPTPSRTSRARSAIKVFWSIWCCIRGRAGWGLSGSKIKARSSSRSAYPRLSAPSASSARRSSSTASLELTGWGYRCVSRDRDPILLALSENI